MEALLIGAGVRWRWLEDPEGYGLTWRDVYVLLQTAPFDSPLAIAQRPKDWIWGHPHSDLLGGVNDKLAALTALHGNSSGVTKADMPAPIPRPWDVEKHVRKLGGKVTKPLTDLAAWIKSRQAKVD